MSVTRPNPYGAFASVSGAGPVTPTPPAYLPNDWLLYFTGCGIGTGSIAVPGGWTKFANYVNATQIICFGLPAVGGDSIPSVTWPAGNSWAVIGVYRGLLLDPTKIVDVALDKQANNNAKDITGAVSSLTPAQDDELIVQFGEKNKTSTSDLTVFTPPTNFTLAASFVPAGSLRPAVAICEWVQAAATVVPAAPIVGSVADGANQQSEGGVFALRSSLIAPTGSVQVAGQTPGVVPALNSVLTPITARQILKRYFLPTFHKAQLLS